MFDEQPDGDTHGECAAEIHRLQAQVADLIAQLAQYQQAEPVAWIEDALRDVAELPDRNSPEGWPEAMLVTVAELRMILGRHATPQPAAVAVAMPEKATPEDTPNSTTRLAYNLALEHTAELNAETVTMQDLARLRGCEQDAARYRWLRKDSPLALYSKGINFWKTLGVTAGKGFDAEVDAAIQASQSQGE